MHGYVVSSGFETIVYENIRHLFTQLRRRLSSAQLSTQLPHAPTSTLASFGKARIELFMIKIKQVGYVGNYTWRSSTSAITANVGATVSLMCKPRHY